MSIQKVQATQSRVGLIAILLAALAVAFGAMLWSNNAKALPTTTITWTDEPAATVAPGETVHYEAQFSLAGGSSTGTTNLVLALPGNVTPLPGWGSSPALACALAGNVLTCTGDNLAAGDYLVGVNVTAPGSGTLAAATATITDTVDTVGPVSSSSATISAAASVSPATLPLGQSTVDFTLEPGITCESDTDGDAVVECAASDVVTTGGVSLVSGPTVAGSVVSVVVSTDGSGTGSVALSLRTITPESEGSVTVASPAAVAGDTAELVHLDVNGNRIDLNDVENNVIGYRHVVCAIDTVVDGTDLAWQIRTTHGSPNVNGRQTAVDVDCGGATGSTITWYSTQPGEQAVEVIDVATGDVVLGFEDTTDPLIKEWNTLLPTTITANDITDEDGRPGPGANLDGTIVELPVRLNQATGNFEGATDTYYENVMGSHVTNTGNTLVTFATGATVTFSIPANQCGVIDIVSGVTNPANPATGKTVTVVSGGTPIGFEVLVDDCAGLGDTVVSIQAAYPAATLGSERPADPALEQITFRLTNRPVEKRPLLAWAGQRVVVENVWGPELCVSDNGFGPGIVTFTKSNGPGAFLNTTFGGEFELRQGPAQIITTFSDDFVGNGCYSGVVFESEDPGQVDIGASVLGAPASQVEFVIYYMKLNTVELDIVTSASKPTHNGLNADWVLDAGNPWDADGDDTHESNVSADVLVRGRVTGWFLNSNPSGRARDASDPNNVLPADRWVMPNDWAFFAGADFDEDGDTSIATAASLRPSYDILFGPDQGVYELDNPAGTGVWIADVFASNPPFEGPYSLIDAPGFAGFTPPAGFAQTASGAYRDTIQGDGVINIYDAPMPPAQITVQIATGDAGFLKEVRKQDVYYTGPADDATLQDYRNPFYYTNIPSHPIAAVTAGGGYQWNSAVQGAYNFWQPTRTLGEFPRSITIYSDNHGEFMVAANGDFNLNFAECATNAIGGGKVCDLGDKVGTSRITATADYPDFRKHRPVSSNNVAIDWIWGGYTKVTVEDGEDPQIKYVVLHTVDRDGFCSIPTGSVSLHPRIGLEVDFLVDAGDGIILDSELNGTIDGTRRFATDVETFSTAANTTVKEFPTIDGRADECQAWIRLSNSLLTATNVLVTTTGDDGKPVAFDVLVDYRDSAELTLNFRWSLVTWVGANNIPVGDALAGEGLNDGGNDISDEVTAIYGWNAASQDWLGYFPEGVGVPGANDLLTLSTGSAYWIAIEGPDAVTWTIATNVHQ